MNVIRPIKQTDYQALHDIAVESGIGFTSLPVNEELLQRKITRAEHAFNKKSVRDNVEAFCKFDNANAVN